MNFRTFTLSTVMPVTLTACAMTGPQASGTFQTHAGYDGLFSAATAAAAAVGFHIVSLDRTTGLITAEQNIIMGHGNATAMTTEITKEPSAQKLHVTFIAPPGSFTLGDFQQNVTDYMSAVRTRVPDLQASR